MPRSNVLCFMLLCAVAGCSPTVGSSAVMVAPDAAADVAAADIAAADGPPSNALVLTMETPTRCCDIPGGTMAVREDGRVERRTCGGVSGSCQDMTFTLPNGAADVAALRRGIETSGLLALPAGVYPADSTTPNVITYHRAGRSDTWSIDPQRTDVPPACTAALDAIIRVLAPGLRP